MHMQRANKALMQRVHIARTFVQGHLPHRGNKLGAAPVQMRILLAMVLAAIMIATYVALAPVSAWATNAAGENVTAADTANAAGAAPDTADEAAPSDANAANTAPDAAAEAAAAEAAADAAAAEAAAADAAEASGDTTAASGENTVNARQTADNSFLYDTSIYELTQADTSFQGNTVQIVGEVVGDCIIAEEDPEKRWITLEAIEDEYESSISVLVDENSISLIDMYGGYNRKGTTLQVRGTFYLACPSHEGIMDIHAESVTLVARGSETKDVFRFENFIFGGVLILSGLVLTLVYRYLRERER